MKALIGLYIYLGARKLNLMKVEKIWKGASADNVAICTMSMTRFIELSTKLRFDDKETRSRRREKDPFAPIRELFDSFNTNLHREYAPSQNLTVDEQLVPWRGRVCFLQYLPSKPDKYGIKFFWICDSHTFYPLQAIPYLGKHGDRKINLGRETVKELAQHYLKSGRNITCDNFFTDIELARWLERNGLSAVGTVRKNKRFLPPSFQKGKGIRKFESEFAFQEGAALVAYKSNDKKHVVALSTMHNDTHVGDDRKKKPEIIRFYNKTKGGVDTFDYMCHSFSCKRKTRRWPMVVFYNMLDSSAIAAFVMYKEKYPDDVTTHGDRGFFNEVIGRELMLDQIQQRRKTLKNPRRRTQLAFKIVCQEWGIESEEELPQTKQKNSNPENMSRKRKSDQGRCVKCPRKKDKKSRKSCMKCDEFVCKDHSVSAVVCTSCDPSSN